MYYLLSQWLLHALIAHLFWQLYTEDKFYIDEVIIHVIAFHVQMTAIIQFLETYLYVWQPSAPTQTSSVLVWDGK